MLAVVVVLAIISLMARKKNGGQKETPVAMPTVIRKRLPTKFDFSQPKSIGWNFKEPNRVEKIDKLAIEKAAINLQIIKKMLAIVGLNEGQKTLEKNGLINFGDGKNKSAYFDVYNNKFSYSEIISSRDQIKDKGEPMAGDWENKIRKTMGLEGVEIRVVSREYKKIVNPRWVTTTESEAEATEIRANYYWGDYPLLGFAGEPMTVLVSKTGRILKMEVEILGKVTMNEETELITGEDLKKIGASGAWLWKVDGDTENEDVGAVTITGVSLGYIYNPEGVVGAYWIGEGNGILGSKPVKVKVIVPAEK